MVWAYLKTSIGKKQIVASTGLALILFLVGHLAGNLLIFKGPATFNAYAKKLASFRPVLNYVEMGLLVIFLIHMYVTSLLVIENIKARGANRYNVKSFKGRASWSTRLMAFSGTYILLFVIWHLLDFTFIDHHGPRSFLADGKSYGLYGVVWNSFADPMHSLLYIVAMMAIGLHLSHGVQSFFQTFGLTNQKSQPTVKCISEIFGFVVALAYSTIPIYIYLMSR